MVISALDPTQKGESAVWTFTTGTGSSTTATCPLVKDATIRGGSYVNVNYGGQLSDPVGNRLIGIGRDGFAFVDGVAAPLKVLVQFDCSAIPSGNAIHNATLSLKRSNMGGGAWPGPVSVYFDPFSGPWNENTVKWSNAPAANMGMRVTGTILTASNTLLETNVTSIVQAWVSGSIPNYGLLISSSALESASIGMYYLRENSPAQAFRHQY